MTGADKSQSSGARAAASGGAPEGERVRPNNETRDRIVEALMRLAARRRFEDITISDIAHEAGVSLADFGDIFPSKGAVLAAFSHKIDRLVLEGMSGEYLSEPARERLYDVLCRRLQAMSPYRAALEGVAQWVSTDPLAAAALNRTVVNSMRFMLEAADIDSEGAIGALRLQALALAWGHVLSVWFDDRDEDICRTKTALDSDISRIESYIERIQDVARLASPLTSLGRAIFGFGGFGGRRKHARRHARDRDEDYEDYDYDARHRRHRHDDEDRHGHARA